MAHFPNSSWTGFFQLLLAKPFQWIFSIKCGSSPPPASGKPYLILFNHATYLDPFFLHIFPKLHISFLTNREYFRFPWLAFLLRRVGCIPKTKGQADPSAIRGALQVSQVGTTHIGVAVTEGRNWDGQTTELVEGTEKLVKKLNMPVIAAILHGAYLSMPRWCVKRHRGPIVIDYFPIISQQESQSLSVAEIRQRILSIYAQDDYHWQKQVHHHYVCAKRAESIERLLFYCPICQTLESIISSGNEFSCTTCQSSAYINEEGFFEPIPSQKAFPFDSPPQWNKWQQAHLATQLRNPSFTYQDADASLWVFAGEERNKKAEGKTGTISFCSGKLFFSAGSDIILSVSPEMAQGVTNQYHDCLEFYQSLNMYRIKLNRRHASPYLWYSILKQAATMHTK